MNDYFPIPNLDQLPVRIDPCPIVEAVYEARFVSPQPWATMPGLLFAEIRKKYPQQKDLPSSQLPEEVRRQDPAWLHLPLIQFFGGDFLVQLGPRVVSLVTKPNAYPGWPAIERELTWLLACLNAAGFIGETERISARYIDFFTGNVFDSLHLGLQVKGQPFQGTQTDVTTVLRRGPITTRLQVSNGAIVNTSEGPKAGSILDMDARFTALDVDLFQNGLERYGQAHDSIKNLFFGLLKPEFLATLNPTYK